MKMTTKFLGIAALSSILACGAAWAGGFFTPGLPVVSAFSGITGNEYIPVDTQLASGANPQSEAIEVSALQTYSQTLARSTVALLPICAASNAGRLAVATDASSPTLGSTVAGSGAVEVIVECSGSAWKVG